MEGCLSALIKLLILAGLFLVGLVTGYLYYLGTFDVYLVRRAFGNLQKLSADDAGKLVDAQASPANAYPEPSALEGRWVRWKGTITEAPPKGEYTQLSVVSADAARKLFVVFVDKPLEGVGAIVGDEVEVLGLVRRTWVLTEDREGHKYPQVLANSVKKLVAPRPGSAAAGGEDGEVAHGAEPAASPSPGGSTAPPASASPPAPAPSAHPSPAKPAPAHASPAQGPRPGSP